MVKLGSLESFGSEQLQLIKTLATHSQYILHMLLTTKIGLYEHPNNCLTAQSRLVRYILGHNFGVDRHFSTKFYTEMENRQPKGVPVLKNQIFENPKLSAGAPLLLAYVHSFIHLFLLTKSLKKVTNEACTTTGAGQ